MEERDDWLKAIENILGAGEGGVNTKSQILMARVIRELVGWSKILANTPDFDAVSVVWESLSPEAKELIDELAE